LHEKFAMSPLKGSRHLGFAAGRRKQGERGIAGKRDLPADRQAMGRGKSRSA
jgi:hypothetical protein